VASLEKMATSGRDAATSSTPKPQNQKNAKPSIPKTLKPNSLENKSLYCNRESTRSLLRKTQVVASLEKMATSGREAPHP